MKRILLAASMAFLSTLSMGAHAWGYEKLVIDDEVVSRVSGVEAEGDHVFKNSELAGGVYIVAAASIFDKEALPKTTDLIRQYFASKGFKVVDRAEQAAVGIRFSVHDMNCDLNVAGIAQAEERGPNAATRITGVALASLVGGGLNAFAATTSRSKDSVDIELAANVVMNPTDEGMSEAFLKKIQYSDPLKAAYYVKDGSAVENVLKNMADQWIKNYVEIE